MARKMKQAHGFSLVEMAIVLVILGLMLGGLVLPLTAQIDQNHRTQTRLSIAEIQAALLGFALLNGRLPCPASATSNGLEDPLGGGICNHPYDGFVPAVTLSIRPTDADGYALDGWGSGANNRLRYAVTTANSSAFTTGINSLSLNPNLRICAAATNISATACHASVTTLSANAVAVVISSGKTNLANTASDEEAANRDNNITFVSHEPTSQFDDQLSWLSYPLLAHELVNAGKLP